MKTQSEIGMQPWLDLFSAYLTPTAIIGLVVAVIVAAAITWIAGGE